MGRTPELLGLKTLKGRSATKDIAGQPIPTPPAFERGVPDCPAWLSPGAKEVWEAYAPMLDDVASIKVADALVLRRYARSRRRMLLRFRGFRSKVRGCSTRRRVARIRIRWWRSLRRPAETC